jgi:hypothetical protein
MHPISRGGLPTCSAMGLVLLPSGLNSEMPGGEAISHRVQSKARTRSYAHRSRGKGLRRQPYGERVPARYVCVWAIPDRHRSRFL